MTFEIEAGGRTRIVEIHRGPQGIRVTVDGRAHVVDVAKAGRTWSLLIGPAKAGPHDRKTGPHDRDTTVVDRETTVVGADSSRPERSDTTVVVVGADFSRPLRSETTVVGADFNRTVVGADFSRPKRSYEIAIVDGAGGGAMVYVNGQPVQVAIAGRGGRRGRSRAADESSGKGGPQHVVAPMPGRIVKVLVKAGDTVAARQGLVVVEAMKMENELRSPKAGTVSDVRVTEGMLVEANAVLVIVS